MPSISPYIDVPALYWCPLIPPALVQECIIISISSVYNSISVSVAVKHLPVVHSLLQPTRSLEYRPLCLPCCSLIEFLQ
ncbi:hypothetical protein FGO68_gene5207 [Halteria grandinella]|uniref:Uncharacterized protein n=1 Tax=Halteria grandinella TaxID=5974 RepID=A0A8J8NVV7_HALGN|nr:hypothetical protein FGO68_gene5207 [Halteria grandinella]